MAAERPLHLYDRIVGAFGALEDLKDRAKMPRKASKATTSVPAGLQSQPSTNPAENPWTQEEWKVKNAKARELIMSTIEQGSEAWGIADQYDNAADIWKALQNAYGGKKGPRTKELGKSSINALARAADAVNETKERVDAVKGQEKQVEKMHRPDVRDGAESAEPNKSWLQESTPHKADTDLSRRDKRLLWALLNGGKDKLDSVTVKTGQQLCAPEEGEFEDGLPP